MDILNIIHTETSQFRVVQLACTHTFMGDVSLIGLYKKVHHHLGAAPSPAIS